MIRIDSANSPSGYAQKDSIAGGIEISNGNERRIESCTFGGNSNHLGLLFFAAQVGLVKGGFSTYPIT